MILDSLFAVAHRSIENPAEPLYGGEYYDDSPWGILGGRTQISASGVHVSRESALRYHAIWRAVNLVAGTIGKLPTVIYKNQPGGKQPDIRHPNYQHLMYRPNAEMTAFDFKKTIESHRLLEGNGYIFCRRAGSGTILEFIPLDPRRTHPMRVNGELFYVTTRMNGQPQVMSRSDVIHVKGLTMPDTDSLIGYPVTAMARDSIGQGIAVMEYGARFFRNSAVPPIVIEYPSGANDPKKIEQLMQNWAAHHASLENAHKPGVLTNGAKANVLAVNARDSQLIDQKRYSLIEIANWFEVPPHKLGENTRLAYNSVEQENQSYLDDGVDFRLCSWEQELRDKVLTEDQKENETHCIEFDRKRLLRANIQARAEYYSKALAGAPWMSRDEVRIDEGMNELEGEEGDAILLPANFQQDVPEPAETVAAGQPTESEPGSAQTDMEVSPEGLNGAQIQAALEVLLSVQLGHIAKEAAIGLLIAVGIPQSTAKSMVDAQLSLPKTEVAPEVDSAPSIAPSIAEPEEDSERMLRDILLYECQRMAERITRNARRVGKKPEQFTDWVESLREDHRSVMVEAFRRPLAACRAVCGVAVEPEWLANKVLQTADAALGELRDGTSDDGLSGAVSEWAGRFVNKDVVELVDGLFQKKERAA